MNRLLLSAALLAAMASPSAAATLGIEIFDNGALIDSTSGNVSGAASLATNDAAFSNILIGAQGSPILPNADLSAVTLDATSAVGFTGSHTLTIDILQDGISGTGKTLSTFTVNGLVNDPGPTTESTFADGALLSSHTFPKSVLDGSAGPLAATPGPFTSDEIQYVIRFTAPDQSFGGSAQLTTGVVPEPATWVMLILGAGLLGWTASTRKRAEAY